MLKFGYKYKKKLYKEYAAENLNLAFGENEFGEVFPDVRETIVEKLKTTNRSPFLARKLMPYTFAKIFFMPILILVFGYLAFDTVLTDGTIGLAFFAAFVGLVMHLCVRRIANSPTRVKLGQIVNSKVVLGDNYLEYSYSSLDPKVTEGHKDTNFVICRIKYSDITAIQYDEKKNAYKLVGTYKVLRYRNYNIKGENSYPIEEEVHGKALEIYDVYHNRDLFALLSEKVRKGVGLCELDSSERTTIILCMLGFGFMGLLDALLYFEVLFRFAFWIANL